MVVVDNSPSFRGRCPPPSGGANARANNIISRPRRRRTSWCALVVGTACFWLEIRRWWRSTSARQVCGCTLSDNDASPRSITSAIREGDPHPGRSARTSGGVMLRRFVCCRRPYISLWGQRDQVSRGTEYPVSIKFSAEPLAGVPIGARVRRYALRLDCACLSHRGWLAFWPPQREHGISCDSIGGSLAFSDKRFHLSQVSLFGRRQERDRHARSSQRSHAHDYSSGRHAHVMGVASTHAEGGGSDHTLQASSCLVS